MIPVTMDINTWANADYTEEFALVADGAPYNLTGITLDMDVRRYPRDATTIFTLTIVATDIQGMRLTDAANGLFQLRINKATLETAYAGAADTTISNAVINFAYDIQMTHSDGLQEILMQGTLAINPGVTRP